MPSREDYLKFFQAADKDGSGALSLEELQSALQKNGYKDKQIRDMFIAVDTSGDNQIDLDEYMSAMGQQPPVVHEGAAMRQVFRSFDQNGDGTVDRSELDALFKEMGRHLPENEIKRMMEMLDKDKSGNIDYEEFVEFFFGKM